MKLYAAVLTAMLLLVGCNSSEKPPAPQSSQGADALNAETLPELPVMGRERRILALGDSLFAGYGIKSGESYPGKLEAALRAKGVNARIANAGVSGDTTADGLQRLGFTLDSQQQAPELVIICLGGNDMLRGLSPEQTRANLDAILTELGKRKIPVLLMGMLAAPNLGADFAIQFNAIYPSLARKHHAALVPFFLQAVIDKPDLKQADHIHPTAQGVEELVAGTSADVVKALPPLGTRR